MDEGATPFDDREEAWCREDGPAAVRAVAWSPDGALIASGGDDRGVHVRRAEDGGVEWLLEGHGEPVQGVVFAPDRPALYSVLRRGVVKAWDLTRGLELASLDLPPIDVPARPRALRIAPDGDWLCVLHGAPLGPVVEVDLRRWRVGLRGSGAGIACEEARYTPTAALAMIQAPLGTLGPRWAVQTISDDDGVRSDGGDLLFRGPRLRVQTAIAPDGASFAHASQRSFAVYALPSGAVRASMTGAFTGDLRHLTLGLRRVVAASGNHELWAWNLTAYVACFGLDPYGDAYKALGVQRFRWSTTLAGGDHVTALALSPDESSVLVGTKRGALLRWRIP